MAVTWLHVSDFHLRDNGPYNQEVILRALVLSVKRFREEEGRTPDIIFATGDIAQQGKATEYESATKFFDDLLDAAGLNRDRLFIVPGNHDVDRKAGRFLLRTFDTKEDADEYFDPDTPIPHLTQKLHAFSEWYNGYFKTIRSFPTNTTCSPLEIVTINNCRLAVLPLNSALFCIDDHDYKKLFIGRRCLDGVKRQLAAADLTIALIHHPLDWLSPIERENIKAALGESVDLLLQGHYHETAMEGIVSANEGYLKLAAGASYQRRNWPNTAMYGTFNCNQITIFPIRYEDAPREFWTLDTSVFPSPQYVGKFFIQRGTTAESPESGKLHATDAVRYQATLKEELGYIRMLGMPSVESVKVNLNDDTFVPLRFSVTHSTERNLEKKDISQDQEYQQMFTPEQVMQGAFKQRRMLLVIGDSGAGKTTLLKYYALCALDKNHCKRLGFPTPINVFYLSLRELMYEKNRGYYSLPENLAIWSKIHHNHIEKKVFADWLTSGTSLVLLDGLDAISNTQERMMVCKWIDYAWSGFSHTFFVVTSRATGYRKDDGIEFAADYERVDVQDFTPLMQERFLTNWFTAAFLKEPCDVIIGEKVWREKQKKKAEERAITIVAHLNIEKNKGLRQLAAVPMILQIMAILWKERGYLPNSRVMLYNALLDYLLELRDKRRGIMPLLSADRARMVLEPVSLWMQEELKTDEADCGAMQAKMQERLDILHAPPSAESFCDYLVKRSGLLAESGGNEYLFRHKSFREYLASVALVKKVLRTPESIGIVISGFGDDWWDETIRFFIAQVDAEIFDLFMKKLFDSPVSKALTLKQQWLLQSIIEEAPQVKVDALCSKLLDPQTNAMRQRVILDCLKSIGKPVALDSLYQFRIRDLAINRDIAERTEEVFLALGGKIPDLGIEKLMSGKRLSFRNQNENYAEYLLIPGGRYLYSTTEQEEWVEDLYVAKYPVSNKLYRSFIASLQSQGSRHEFPVLLSVFSAELNAIAQNNSWGQEFASYLKESKNLADLFRSKFDAERKFDGVDQPVIGVTWYAARAYCLWLSILEGEVNRYRLPTEVEWEWAAGGKQGTIGQKVRVYPWPDTKGKPTSMLANHAQNIGATTPVGSYPEGATPEGLFDMAGNVYEWMENRYHDGKQRYALRGGGWDISTDNLRCSCRNFNYPYQQENNYGFRVVRSSHSLQGHGKKADTERFYRAALLITENEQGKEHPSEAALLNNLAELLQDQGKYAEAELLCKRALAILEKLLGTDHPSVATSLNNIAGLLQLQGNYLEAEPLYRRSLEIVEKSMGNEHPAVATSLNNLARLLRVQGKYSEAEPLFNRALAINDDIPPLYVPSDLVNACVENDCVAFVGSGIGARAGLPTWVGLVEGLLLEAVSAGFMDKKSVELQRAALREGEVNAVADNAVSAFGLEKKALQDYYRRMNVSDGPLPRAYHLLRTIPFSAILTSNYDDLLDRVLEGSDYQRGLTPSNSERLLELLASRKTPFLLKLYGDLYRPETLILAPTDYQNLVYSNIGFARFMEGLFFSRTLLFIGTSLEGLTDYLSVFRFPSELLVRHYALVAVSGRGWEAKAEVLQRRYNIFVIPFRPSAGFTEVDTFLDELTQSVAQRKKDANPDPCQDQDDSIGPKLKKVVLENIGPFEKLELDFEENWKILLGDNGVGKTTILKAIAVAIVGSEARHSAAPLLRVGQPLGSIRLVTLENPSGYLVEIQRVGTGVEIVSYSGRALEAEGWVAIGFPPLRATSWAPTQGPQGISVKRPSADDLLPLVRGVPDTRMDDLKQWIVNTEALSRREGAPDIDRNRAKEVLKSFFDIVNQLTDQSIEQFEEVTPDFRVLVRTNDGQIPIESLSQGMTSLLSWVGILLQRLYEVHYDSNNVTDPTQEYALVLMDEIDAHMHPKWQQTLVAKLKKIFPNVQVIASTHSPLVVAGMPVSQIVRFERNEDGQVKTVHIDDDMSIGRTDQVLTGDLFGLETTLALDQETQESVAEYERLLSKPKRSTEEENEFYRLHGILDDHLPPPEETKLERRTQELVFAVLEADYSPENLQKLKASLIKKVKAIVKSMGWKIYT